MLRNHLFKLPSPYINQFISADSIVPGYANPQNLNRYSYVTNNPLRYTDPTGHMADYGGNEGGGGCSSVLCFPQPPSNPPGGGGGNGKDNDDNEGDDECPDWNVCLSDASIETMQDYWGANNDFTNIITWGGALTDLTVAGFGYLVSQGYLTGPSLALIVSYATVAVIDPLPLEEIAAGIRGGVVVWSLVATAGGSDIQNINNALVETGAYNSGGSITANWDGATITGPNGTQTVDTWIPFAAPVSLFIWSIPDPAIGASIDP